MAVPDWRYPEPPARWPEPYERRTNKADPWSSYPGKGTRVKILDARDPHGGQTGVVQRVVNDAGELVLTVAFDDGTTDIYFADQVHMRRGI